jgi:hypothetical protein
VREQPPATHVRLLRFLDFIRFEVRQTLLPGWPPDKSGVRWTIRIVILSIPFLVGYMYDITLWDWMKLLVVPLVIAGIGIWFNAQQRTLELESTETRAQSDALEAYLKDMTTLLVDKGLRKAQPGDDLTTAARARTLTVLNRLSDTHKIAVLRFLNETKLIDATEEQPIVSLRGVYLAYAQIVDPDPYLQRANLQGANLPGAELYEAQLEGANLQEAYLGTADLYGANLQGAELQNAVLYQANLQGANLACTNLRGAELFEANLAGVDLSEAKGLTQAQLEVALGDPKTQVPVYLKQPDAWSMAIEEQRSRLSQLD